MRVAVLSLTRDRLDYTKHCFASLRKFAGCEYDHYVLDNASTDGTQEWLLSQNDLYGIHVGFDSENIGIGGGLNHLLDLCGPENFDAIVHFDNDCELTQPNTIRDLCQFVVEGNCILSPRILGLENPPQATRRLKIGDEIILDMVQIGGICLTAPAWVFEEYRYPSNLPLWGMDDAHLCRWFREQGGTCGYVQRLEAWHYEGRQAQRERYPEYEARKVAEMAQ